MKFSSAPGWKRSRLPLIAMLALAATMGLAGCENDEGGAAAPPDSGSGGTGPTGPTGPADMPISQGGPVTQHRHRLRLTAQQIADIGTLIATIDSAAVTGNKPVLEITVKTEKGGAVLGLAATTLRLGVAKLVPAVSTACRHDGRVTSTVTTPEHPDAGPGQCGPGQHRKRRGHGLDRARRRQVPLCVGRGPDGCHDAHRREL